MSLVRDRDGKRLHIKSKLMGESLVSNTLLDGHECSPDSRGFSPM